MPFNGAGSFTPPGASFPAVANTLIESAKFNAVINDIASGLSTCITKDGQTTVTANIPMAGFVFTGLGSGVASRTRSASIGDVQDGSVHWGGTAGGTADALTLTLAPAITAYSTGMRIYFKSGASANTGAATLQVNGIATPKALQMSGGALAAGQIAANQWFCALYDGAAFQLLQVGGAALTSVLTTRGDLVRRGSAGPERVALGTSGQVLSSDGTDAVWADPTQAASQAQQETATATTVYVSPGRQQFHPSAAKAWIKCTATGTIDASYNVASITDLGTGSVRVTFTNAFSSGQYAVMGTAAAAGGVRSVVITSQAAGSFDALCVNSSDVAVDPTNWFFVCFGDL